MTDNEIIKALKCCTGDLEGCASCPLYDHPCDMGHKLNYYALDLINRQKAEIEQLKIENRILSQKRISFPERLEIDRKARAEAVKEFADEFKKIAVCGKTSVFRFPYYQISMEAFDNLVKEMVGEG